MLGQVAGHGPQRIDGRGCRTRALDRPQYGRRPRSDHWPTARASRSVRASVRRPGETTRSAAVSVSPSASWSAICLASVPVRNSPSCRLRAQLTCPKKPSSLPGRSMQEPPVEEPVGPLARGLRRHHAAVAGRAVQEILRILGRALGADRVGRAPRRPVQGCRHDLFQPGWLAELDQAAEGAVAVGGGRDDQQPGRRGRPSASGHAYSRSLRLAAE